MEIYLSLSFTLTGSQALAIMAGGSMGSLARYVLSSVVSEKLGGDFPYGTLAVNFLGSFVMGFLAFVLVERIGLDPLLRLGIFVGFLGAFTTFSTFSMETMNLFEEGLHLRALLNMFANVVLSVLAVWLGFIIGKTIS